MLFIGIKNLNIKKYSFKMLESSHYLLVHLKMIKIVKKRAKLYAHQYLYVGLLIGLDSL